MVEHTQNRPYKAKFENKARDFCASSAAPAVVFVVVLFISWIGTKRTKKRTKDKKEHIAWFVSFVLGRFACVATRTICPIFKCTLDIVQIYRYRYWYSCSFCIWQFQLRQCFCFALLCVRSFLLFELNSPWLDFCVQTDRPTERNEQRSILNLRILYTKKIDYVCSTVYPCVVSKTTRDVCLLDWISMAGARILWE